MHIIMGLGNVLFNELKRVVEELDKSENNYNSEHHANISKEIKDLYEEKENLETLHANYNLDKMINNNDTERLPYLGEGNVAAAK